MTVHVLVADPPHAGYALPELAETSPLSTAEAADLYAAMLRDVAAAVATSGGELLVNYPAESALPDDLAGTDPEAELREVVSWAVADLDDVRFEVQVGSTFAARAGNAVTHLLDEEGEASAAVLDGRAPTLARTDLDRAAMTLRRNEVVVGPAPGGRVAYLGLSEPIDFEAAYAPPAVETLAARGADAGHDVDFLSMHPVVETGDDLVTLLATVRARQTAGRAVPEHTAAALEEFGLRVVEDEGGTRLER